MSDKKLTDEEIIKALEDYIKENEFEYFHSNMVGEYPLIRKSLDLINRQKAEIERLKECPKCVYEYDGEMYADSGCEDFTDHSEWVHLPCVAMVEQFIKDGKFDRRKNGAQR